jgi:hypothetical protein
LLTSKIPIFCRASSRRKLKIGNRESVGGLWRIAIQRGNDRFNGCAFRWNINPCTKATALVDAIFQVIATLAAAVLAIASVRPHISDGKDVI